MNYSLKLQLNEVFFYAQFSVGMYKFSVGMHKFSVGIELIKNHFLSGKQLTFGGSNREEKIYFLSVHKVFLSV
jgi:hypothetical protein